MADDGGFDLIIPPVAGPGGAVTSVNGRAGAVVLSVADVTPIAESDVTNLVTDLSNKQSSDSDLTAIAALTPSNDDIIQRKAGAWTNRTPAQVKADLALVEADVSGLVADLAARPTRGQVVALASGSFNP